MNQGWKELVTQISSDRNFVEELQTVCTAIFSFSVLKF